MEIRSKSGRRYDREFKENAVALVRSGRSKTEVARDLGVSMWSLGRWRRQRDILKKAVGILSAEMPPNATH